MHLQSFTENGPRHTVCLILIEKYNNFLVLLSIVCFDYDFIVGRITWLSLGFRCGFVILIAAMEVQGITFTICFQLHILKLLSSSSSSCFSFLNIGNLSTQRIWWDTQAWPSKWNRAGLIHAQTTLFLFQNYFQNKLKLFHCLYDSLFRWFAWLLHPVKLEC